MHLGLTYANCTTGARSKHLAIFFVEGGGGGDEVCVCVWGGGGGGVGGRGYILWHCRHIHPNFEENLIGFVWYIDVLLFISPPNVTVHACWNNELRVFMLQQWDWFQNSSLLAGGLYEFAEQMLWNS